MSYTPKGRKGPTANFRTYEAQARLLAAVIATANPKLDFNAIAKHIGSDASAYSVDHRLRPIKQLARLQAKYLKDGKDPGELPVEKAAIHKLFGESTPAGLEFHFREAKATGKAQQEALKDNLDVTKVPVGPQTRHAKAKGKGQNSVPSTPSTSRKRDATKSGAATTGGRVRKYQRIQDLAEDDVDSFEEDYDELDQDITPSKPRPHNARNPVYAVNNSTTNSDTDVPLSTPQSYAQIQRENQTRARAEFQADAFQGHSYGSNNGHGAEGTHRSDARMDNYAAQHQSLFGGPGQAWSTTSAIPSTYSDARVRDHDETEDMDDFLMSDANRNTNSDATRAPAQVLDSIKRDPFETSGAESDYVDLTKPHKDTQITSRGNQRAPAYVPYNNQDYSVPRQDYHHYDDDGDYGDGEI